jgi:hypothetical protein
VPGCFFEGFFFEPDFLVLFFFGPDFLVLFFFEPDFLLFFDDALLLETTIFTSQANPVEDYAYLTKLR